MKKIFSSIVLTLAMVSSFMACQEYKIDSQPEAPLALQVDAQDTYTLLATTPSKIVFNVSANTPWTIESDQQWCKIGIEGHARVLLLCLGEALFVEIADRHQVGAVVGIGGVGVSHSDAQTEDGVTEFSLCHGKLPHSE